jgi:hypothetical protein
MTALILKRASASRSSGEWNDDDFDVLAESEVVGRIMKAAAAPVGTPGLCTLAYGQHEDRSPIYGYEPTREAAMAAFAKSWRRELLSEPHHETCEVDRERAESAECCKTSNPALRCAKRKHVARLDLRAVPIQLAGGFPDPKEAQSPLGNGSNTLWPIVWTFVRDLLGADIVPVSHLMALSLCAPHPRGIVPPRRPWRSRWCDQRATYRRLFRQSSC